MFGNENTPLIVFYLKNTQSIFAQKLVEFIMNHNIPKHKTLSYFISIRYLYLKIRYIQQPKKKSKISIYTHD
jgi:hypothetical protein